MAGRVDITRREPHRDELFESGGLLLLENESVCQDETAIAEHQNRAGEEHPLGPLQDPFGRRRFDQDLHRQDAWIRRYSGCHIASSTC